MTLLKLIVDPDLGGAVSIQGEQGSVFPSELGVGDDLLDRFELWRMFYKERDETPNFDLEAFNEEGRAIAKEFQSFFAGRYTVSYLRLLDKDGTRADSWKEEQIA